MSTASHHPVKRLLDRLGLRADGDMLAFGVVPVACAVVGALVDGPAIVPVLFFASGATGAVVARRHGYTRARSAWYAAVAMLALTVWSFLATPMVESLG